MLAVLYFALIDRSALRVLGFFDRLRTVVRHYYENVPVYDLWNNIMRCQRRTFPSQCLLIDVLPSIAVSNGFVEPTSSFLTAVLSDRRLVNESWNHEIMKPHHSSKPSSLVGCRTHGNNRRNRNQFHERALDVNLSHLNLLTAVELLSKQYHIHMVMK